MKAPWLLGLLLVQGLALPCCGITLRQFLSDQSIPAESFSKAELEAEIQGLATKHGEQTIAAIQHLSGELLIGPIDLVEYEPDHPVLRSTLPTDPDGMCGGSVLGFDFVDGYTLVSTHINPSAECLLILDNNLKLANTLYGFDPVEVARDSILIIENMIHFAPVHPERLQLTDLLTGKTQELYPPKGDLLRTKLARENKRQMPSQATCMQTNDPCNPQLFDEDIRSLATDEKGQFAFIAEQSASHATKAATPPEIVASQAVFYLYKLVQGSWRYCERAADASEASSGSPLDWNAALARCQPTLAVVPDLSTAGNNPFLPH